METQTVLLLHLIAPAPDGLCRIPVMKAIKPKHFFDAIKDLSSKPVCTPFFLMDIEVAWITGKAKQVLPFLFFFFFSLPGNIPNTGLHPIFLKVNH